MDANFEELSHDTNIIARLKRFSEAAFKIQDMVELVSDPSLFDKLSNADKIKYNLLLSYSLNSLFWMYLRAEGVQELQFSRYELSSRFIHALIIKLLQIVGIDPSNHRIRSENERLKKAMVRAKQINDKNTLMPRVNKDAAKRFMRNSLWELKQRKDNNMEKKMNKSEEESPPI